MFRLLAWLFRSLAAAFFPLLLAWFGVMASVSPHDLYSNVAKWSEEYGIKPPEWLVHKSADRIVLVIVIILGVIYLAYKNVPSLAGRLMQTRRYLAWRMHAIQLYYYASPGARERAIARENAIMNRIMGDIPTLEDRVTKEFPAYAGSSSATLHVPLNGAEKDVIFLIFNDAISNAQFAVFVVDAHAVEQAEVCIYLAQNFPKYRSTFMRMFVSGGTRAPSIPSGKSVAVFTKRLYIYVAGQMSVPDMHMIQTAFLEADVDDVVFRDLMHLY